MGEGLLAHLGELLSRQCPAAHYGLITDSTVGPLYADAAAAAIGGVAPVTGVTFPAGERNKTRETWSTLADRLLAAGMGRDGAIVALGGGVVGDLAGFVAATHLRAAVTALEDVIGLVTTDDVLDRVFSSFCVGK